MIQSIRQQIVMGLVSLLLMLGLLTPALTGVSSAGIGGNLCEGATAASGEDCQNTGTNPEDSLTSIAETITRWFSIIVGAISIIMIIYGGFRYITSGGDSGRVGTAKNTIIYAIVGLIIVVLAQVIVNVVVSQSAELGGAG